MSRWTRARQASETFGLTGSPVGWKPPRDRRADTRAVACPVCRVEPRQPCVRADGSELRVCHVPRRRMAVRKGLYL